MRAIAVFVLTLLLTGCAMHRKIQAYQAWATRTCEQHRSSEECQPLPYPSGIGER